MKHSITLNLEPHQEEIIFKYCRDKDIRLNEITQLLLNDFIRLIGDPNETESTYDNN